MSRLVCFVLCFAACYVLSDAATVSFITPCKPKDAACQKASSLAAQPYFIAGVPELGLPPADPIILDDIQIEEQDIKFGFKNMKVTGINKCKILDAYRDADKSTMKMVLECPIIATGLYTLNGKLLFIPAEGNGDFKIETGKTILDVILKLKVVENGGKKYWKITSFDYTFDLVDKASITLENLFGGDETRAKPLREVLQNGSNDLIKELGGPIIKEIITKVIEIVKKFFKAVPISELELP